MSIYIYTGLYAEILQRGGGGGGDEPGVFKKRRGASASSVRGALEDNVKISLVLLRGTRLTQGGGKCPTAPLNTPLYICVMCVCEAQVRKNNRKYYLWLFKYEQDPYSNDHLVTRL